METIIKTPYNLATCAVSSIAFYELYKETQEGALAKTIFNDSSFFKYYFYYRVILAFAQFPIHVFLNGIRYSTSFSKKVSDAKPVQLLKGKKFSERIRLCDMCLFGSVTACGAGVYLLSSYPELKSFLHLEYASLAIWGGVFFARMASRALGTYDDWWYLYKTEKKN